VAETALKRRVCSGALPLAAGPTGPALRQAMGKGKILEPRPRGTSPIRHSKSSTRVLGRAAASGAFRKSTSGVNA
jgi:hypothetical protein